MGGILNTRLGTFVKAMATATLVEIEKTAYNESVLAQMADLNTESQLYEKGVFADGSDTPEYAPMTTSFYKPLATMDGRDGKSDHMTFKDTGEMYNSVEYIFNGDLKANWLDRYNLIDYGQLIGLTDESMAFIRPEIAQNIREFILSKL